MFHSSEQKYACQWLQQHLVTSVQPFARLYECKFPIVELIEFSTCYRVEWMKGKSHERSKNWFENFRRTSVFALENAIKELFGSK